MNVPNTENGANNQNRTDDLFLTKEVLYRLSYVGLSLSHPFPTKPLSQKKKAVTLYRKIGQKSIPDRKIFSRGYKWKKNGEFDERSAPSFSPGVSSPPATCAKVLIGITFEVTVTPEYISRKVHEVREVLLCLTGEPPPRLCASPPSPLSPLSPSSPLLNLSASALLNWRFRRLSFVTRHYFVKRSYSPEGTKVHRRGQA